MNKNAILGGGFVVFVLHIFALYLDESWMDWFTDSVGWGGSSTAAWVATILGFVLLMTGIRMIVHNKDQGQTAGGIISLIAFVIFLGGLVSLLHNLEWTSWDGADALGGYRRQYFFSTIFFFGLFTALAGSTTILFKPGKPKSQMWGYALTGLGVVILILYFAYGWWGAFEGGMFPDTAYELEVSRLFIAMFAIIGGLFGGFFCAGLILAFIIQEPGDLEDLDLGSITGAGPGELSADEE